MFLRDESLKGVCKEVSGSIGARINMLFDTFPLFKRVGVRKVYFHVLPARAARLQYDSSNVVHSSMGMPYPSLPCFIQSLLDMRNGVDLADAVDGMDLSEQWGIDNLCLADMDDMRWAEWANETIRRADPQATFALVPDTKFSREKLWQRLTKTKQKRAGYKYPPEKFATRFRMHGSKDPTTVHRYTV